MVVPQTCCCGTVSPRTGSFCVAFCAAIYFIVTLLVSSLSLASVYAEPAADSAAAGAVRPPVDPAFTGLLVVLLVLAALGIVSTVLLVCGLVREVGWMLVPLMLTLSVTALVDCAAVTVTLVQDTVRGQPLDGETLALLFVDLAVLSANTWCVTCVVSQYRVISRPDPTRGRPNPTPQPGGTVLAVVSADLAPGESPLPTVSATTSRGLQITETSAVLSQN